MQDILTLLGLNAELIECGGSSKRDTFSASTQMHCHERFAQGAHEIRNHKLEAEEC